MELYRQKKQAKLWHDYGPTLAMEELAEQHGIAISRESLRKWLIEAKLWRPGRVGVEQAHVWRARRARYGELVQWDTSEHDWLEGRDEKLYLIAMIDDATSRLTAGFVRHDSTEENLRQLRAYVEQHGRPVSVYTDKASLFQIAPRAIHHRDAPPQQLTQIGRTLKELNIEWIAGHSPQAKGRIERAFQTAQDRLVKGLRQVGAHDVQTANAYLQQVYVPLWNRRFRREPQLAGDAHRTLLPGMNLDSVLSIRESRTVSQDHTVRWHGAVYRVERKQIKAALRGATCAAGATTRWQHVDVLAKPSAGPGALRSHTRREWRAACHPAPSDTGQIGAGESSGPTAFSRCASAMERQLRPSSRSTALASHARFSTAS